MITNKKGMIIALLAMTIGSAAAFAQETAETAVAEASAVSSAAVWTLDDCINYAKEQNLTIRKSRLQEQTAGVNLEQARAAYWPTLNLSNNYSLRYMPFSGEGDGLSSDGVTMQNNSKLVGSGSLGLNLGWTVWNGSRQKTIDQQRVEQQISQLDVAVTENEVAEQVMLLYMRVQYAEEGIRVSEKTVEVSEELKERADAMLRAGAISKSEQAQVESQWATDRYNLVSSQANYRSYLLQLKQTLELTSDFELALVPMEATDEEILAPLPSLNQVYASALDQRPEIQAQELSVESAEIGIAKAKAGYYPSISLSAGSSISLSTAGNVSAAEQITQGWNNSIGLNINVPIVDQRQTKSAVEKARIQKETAEISLLEQQKSLYKTIEQLWLDAESAQLQYEAAKAKCASADESYRLIQEQFRVGAKHATDLSSAQQTYLQAEQELLQTKYMAIYSRNMLNFYGK